jgi:hypothetical protein
MPSAVRTAVDTYVRAWSERDPAARAALLQACFAVNGRFVTRGREVRGRAALAEEMARLHADPRLLGIRVIGAIDAGVTTFRLRAVADMTDGTTPENLEVGEIDADGRIALVLTFTGPFGEGVAPTKD